MGRLLLVQPASLLAMKFARAVVFALAFPYGAFVRAIGRKANLGLF